GPEPSTRGAQSWAERLKRRVSVTSRTPLPSSKPSVLTSRGPSRSLATATSLLARQTPLHLPTPSVTSSDSHEDIIMVDESTSRAPDALLNNSITPGYASDAAILDRIRQLAADLRAAFARSFVEERHRCPRTFIELGP
ncbi:hypothetical protein BD309DRAFT_878791, partial [Dichomitus squalens]